MRPSEVFIAVDTSAYTTSVAAYADGRVLFDGRKMLEVPKGSRGLRQSEAVFAHIKNLESLFREKGNCIHNIKSVAYSEKPCPKDGSYMPVFRAGVSHAMAIAYAANAKLFPLTHQHGHIYCAFLDSNIPDGHYGAMHISGGTLDVLSVCIINGIVREIKQIGGTLDITCGQLIDRIGVKSGLPFPSGEEAGKLYRAGAEKLCVNVEGLYANLSGAETQAISRLESGEDSASVCSAVIDCAAETLARLAKNAAAAYGLSQFIFTGGVMRSDIIRAYIKKICAESGIGCILVRKKYCSDNACGLAFAAQLLYKEGEQI